MLHVPQQKVVSSGEIRTWTLDLAAMSHTAGWAERHPDVLEGEVERIQQAFPTLLAAVGVALGDQDAWVEAAEPMLCSECADELVVFDRGTRCAACQREFVAPPRAYVGFVGRIPALISGRPFERVLNERLAAWRAQGDTRAELFESSLLRVGERTYLAPRFALWFSESWPHSDPPVMVWPEYFEILDIPPDHVYLAPPYYRLCLYASWTEQPACKVLQQRVVPRLLIDLMVADLHALGRLDQALELLDASLYEIYNMVGRVGAGTKLKQVYEELVARGAMT